VSLSALCNESVDFVVLTGALSTLVHCIVQKRMYVYTPALVAAARTVFRACSHQNKSKPEGVCDLPH
jgi:hypothetical protein